MRTLWLWGVLWLSIGGALAQQEVSIVPLRHRSVEQVIPVLEPLVEPGGALSGMNDQLFIRASARNREALKRALAVIDVPARRLMIRVRLQCAADEQQRDASAGGRVVLGHASTSLRHLDLRAGLTESHTLRSENSGLMVQTIEGGRAFIQVGTSVPVALRQVVVGPHGWVATESVVYRDLGQGFYAEPRLSGDRVTLDISQQDSSPAALGPGSANVQRLATTVAGRLGEWIELGGSGQQEAANARGILSRSGGELRESRSIWLQVEEVR